MSVVLVPATLALLPEYASLTDPVADLRKACVEAVATLGPDVQILASGAGRSIALHLLEATADARQGNPGRAGRDVLAVGNGTAKRTEKAPGHLDDRAASYDDALRESLTQPSPDALTAMDLGLAADLWADVHAIAGLGAVLTPADVATVHYDADPFGVQYWVISWGPGER